MITRVDVATGKRQLVKEWTPADRAGVIGYDSAGISADGKTIVYSYNRVVGDLFLLNGLEKYELRQKSGSRAAALQNRQPARYNGPAV